MNDEYRDFVSWWLLDTGEVAVIRNVLFGLPLYAYYVIRIDQFQPGEIEGMLMTPPFEIAGPYESHSAAYASIEAEVVPLGKISNPS